MRPICSICLFLSYNHIAVCSCLNKSSPPGDFLSSCWCTVVPSSPPKRLPILQSWVFLVGKNPSSSSEFELFASSLILWICNNLMGCKWAGSLEECHHRNSCWNFCHLLLSYHRLRLLIQLPIQSVLILPWQDNWAETDYITRCFFFLN